MLLTLLISVLSGSRAERERQEAVATAVSKIEFLLNAQENFRDFSGTHRFPAQIEDLVNQILDLEPGYPYAIKIKARMPEIRAIAKKIVALRPDFQPNKGIQTLPKRSVDDI
jgi:hypothetical protein